MRNGPGECSREVIQSHPDPQASALAPFARPPEESSQVGRTPRGRMWANPVAALPTATVHGHIQGSRGEVPSGKKHHPLARRASRKPAGRRSGQLGRDNGTNGRHPAPTRPRGFGGAGVQHDRWCRRPPTRAFEPPLDRTTVFRPRTHGPSVAARFFDRAPNRWRARQTHHRSWRSIRSNTFPCGSGQMTAFSCAIQSPGGSARAIAGRSGSAAASAYRQNGCGK